MHAQKENAGERTVGRAHVAPRSIQGRGEGNWLHESVAIDGDRFDIFFTLIQYAAGIPRDYIHIYTYIDTCHAVPSTAPYSRSVLSQQIRSNFVESDHTCFRHEYANPDFYRAH
jgi:hypothetical protein